MGSYFNTKWYNFLSTIEAANSKDITTTFNKELYKDEKLAVIAKPDICVITNIGMCHLENLSNRNGVLKAKTEMFKFMSDNGSIILNGDDDKLITIDEYKGIKPIFYGMNKEFALYGENVMSLGLKGTFFTVNFMNGEGLEIYVRIPGKHMVYNSMAAAAVGEVLGMNPDEIKKGIEKIRTVLICTFLIFSLYAFHGRSAADE